MLYLYTLINAIGQRFNKASMFLQHQILTQEDDEVELLEEENPFEELDKEEYDDEMTEERGVKSSQEEL